MAKLKEVRVTGLPKFNTLRVRPTGVTEFGKPSIYVIDEIATEDGNKYITWPEHFSTIHAALEHIAKLCS